MLRIKGKCLITTQNEHFESCAIILQKTALTHFTEKSVLLNFVNLATIFGI